MARPLFTKDYIKTQVHRLNERIRYTAKTYGVMSSVYERLVESAKFLVAGSGTSLKVRKNGMISIPETKQSIDNIFNSRTRTRTGPGLWISTVTGASPKGALMDLASQYGIKKEKGMSNIDLSNKIDIVVASNKLLTTAINTLMDNRILGSDEVNEFCSDRQKALDSFQDFLNSRNGHFDPHNSQDLLDLGYWIKGVRNKRPITNWGVNSNDNSATASAFVSGSYNKPTAKNRISYQVNKSKSIFNPNKNNPWANAQPSGSFTDDSPSWKKF